MRSRLLSRLVHHIAVGAVVFPLLLLGSDSGLRPEGNKIEGIWSDACPCSVPCPCWRAGRANVSYCLNVQVFHINQGRYRGKDFSGLTFVLVNVPRSNYGQPFPYVIYADYKSNRVDADEILDLFGTGFGLIPERGVQFKSVASKIARGRHQVNIAGVLTYDVALVGNTAMEPVPETKNYLYPWLLDPEQWQTRRLSYERDTEKTSYVGRNALAARFQMRLESRNARDTR